MLELFVLNTCPYCKKVMSYFDDKKIKYEKIDISNPDNVLKLMTLGGKDQVPFLYNSDTDDKIYESNDIIEYVRKRA